MTVFRKNAMARADHGDERRRLPACPSWPLRGRHSYTIIRLVRARWISQGLEQPGQGELCFFSKQVIGVRIVSLFISSNAFVNRSESSFIPMIHITHYFVRDGHL